MSINVNAANVKLTGKPTGDGTSRNERRDWLRNEADNRMICHQYRRWISSLGCCIDSCPLSERSGMDAAHTGARGLGQKSSDLATIPLCRRHHQEFDSNPRAFAEKYTLDIPALVEALNGIGLPGAQDASAGQKASLPSVHQNQLHLWMEIGMVPTSTGCSRITSCTFRRSREVGPC